MNDIILSTDAFFDNDTGKPFEGIEDELRSIIGNDSGRNIIIISARKNTLKDIPKKFNPQQIPFRLRGSGNNMVKFLRYKTGLALEDILVIGAKDSDMQTANNLKAILLRAEYAKSNNPEASIYKKEYGLPLLNVNAIGKYLNSFQSIENPWYYKVEIDRDTNLIALTSANTFTENSATGIKIKNEWRNLLKNNTHINDNAISFELYAMVAFHLMMDELIIYDFWDIYPSSKKDKLNEDLIEYAKKGAHIFAKRFYSERLFIRNKNSSTRHEESPETRISKGCDDQFDTLNLNSFYKGKIESKNICIVDDFTRHGTSCETVRYMLKSAGVNKILFIAIGKFGTKGTHNKYDYTLNGDPYGKFSYSRIGINTINGIINPKTNKEMVISLGGLI
jgi:hypothetical protein